MEHDPMTSSLSRTSLQSRTPLLSRRRLLAAGLASSLVLAGCTTTGTGSDAFPQYFSSISVDITPLREKGLGPFADLIGAATLDEMRRRFADRMDKNGPRLVVRLTSVAISAFPDGGGENWRGRGGGGGGTDSLDGEALALGRNGEIIARHPQLAVLAVNRSILDPDEPGRAVALGRAYAQWLRRQLIR